MTRVKLKSLDGFKLNLDYVKGRGIPILAIHGFTGNISTWDSLSTTLPEHSIIRLDMLGHGLSDSPDNPQLYDMGHTQKAISEVLDLVEVNRVHWLGYSMGGRVALAIAINLPQRTASLMLESASPGLSGLEERKSRVASDAKLALLLKEKGIQNFVEYWESLPLWKSQERLSLEVRRKLRNQRLTNNPIGLANSLIGIGTGVQSPRHQRLSELIFPTLFIAGEEDIKYVQIAQQMHTAVPGSQLVIIKQSGHAAHLEQPAAFNSTILEFLHSISPMKCSHEMKK